MKNKIVLYIFGLSLAILAGSCQKMERPELSPDFPKDPPVPPYEPLKSFWAFENNITDQGENKLDGTATTVTYVAGITGQAVKIGNNGSILLPAIGQLNTDQNGFVSSPADTLKKLGSFTVSWWMNGAGPVDGGAQGIFAFSNKTQFWGNFEVFLENYTDASDANAAWIKIHMFNSNVSGGGEQWTENTKFNNVLNRWTHMVITYDQNTSMLSIYKDGVPTNVNNQVLGGGSYGKLAFDDFNGLVLGTFQFQTDPSLTNHGPEPWAKAFNGALDQFRIYNKVLSAAEITDLYNSKQ